MSQADLLQVLRHIQNLKVLSREKEDLRVRFDKLISTTLAKVNALQNKMPTSEVPKIVKKHERERMPKEEKEAKKKTYKTKGDSIEEELKAIHAKLEELNAFE